MIFWGVTPFHYYSLKSTIQLFISFACPKETNQRKRQPQIFFGLNILSVAHALQLVVLRPPQTVMLTLSQPFATSKMLIYFQKRFDGIYRLTAIWVRISINKKILINIWVSNGLREFWDKATVLRLAA
jgi:hypothetical protein